MNEWINIITRVHNAPKHFKICYDSVKNQTYKYINWTIIADTLETVKYLREDYKIDPFYVDGERYKRLFGNAPAPKGHRPGLYWNLYFNQIDNELIEGQILYLDVSDYLSSPTIIEEIMNESEKDTMLYFKVKIGNRYVPSVERTFPVLNDFSGSGFLYHTDYWGNDLWAGYSGSDHHCGMLLNATIPNKKWINKTVVIAPSANMGREIE